jgi:hypothetical protein
MQFTYGTHRVDVMPVSAPDARRYEREMQNAGFSLPFLHRTAAAELEPDPGPLFFAIRNTAGMPCGWFAAQRRPSRALPGHFVLRVERFGSGFADDEAHSAGVRALADVSRESPRILRTYIGIFSTDRGVQQAIASHLTAGGFQRNHRRRGYSHTLLVDLRPDEDVIFASLQASARRNIRAVAKHRVVVRPVDSLEFGPRMDELVKDAFTRTGGDAERQDWAALIRFSARHPELSRLVGLFRTDRAGPPSLLAFTHAVHHGDFGQYCTAASTRDPDVRVPQTYVLVWDLLRWAKQHGARFFDFGGITPVSHDGSDPLQGISEFKRFFSGTEVTVGDEWIFEPSPLKAGLARVVTSVARSVPRF